MTPTEVMDCATVHPKAAFRRSGESFRRCIPCSTIAARSSDSYGRTGHPWRLVQPRPRRVSCERSRLATWKNVARRSRVRSHAHAGASRHVDSWDTTISRLNACLWAVFLLVRDHPVGPHGTHPSRSLGAF